MKNLKSRKLYLQVYDELKDYIVQNQLKPGDKLPTEMEMCNLLGVSRNVLREAIKSLEISGIVSSKPGVGMIIQEFNTDFLFHTLLYNLTGDSEKLLAQTLAVRRSLELGFLQEAFEHLTLDDLTSLQAHLATMQTIQRENCSTCASHLIFGAEFYEADANFHQTLFASTGNTILSSIITAVWACDKYHKQHIEPAYMAQTVAKHEQIVAALLAKDFEAFKHAMYYHFNSHYKTYE
ncbi:MAG: FadR/GntR family transcriptional regulator [Cellulosilyticaceae bacterium]